MKSFICAVLALMVGVTVQAKSVDDLYDAKILVADQQLVSRQAGARLGLLEVIQKVSGFPVPLDNLAVVRALKIADQYLYQYSYATLAQDEVGAASPGSRWLDMRFEGKSIQRLIKKAKLPRWGKNRPSIMVWLAVDAGGERNMISDGVDHLAMAALRDGAKKRGLPLVYPVYDLEDSIKLPLEQLWGLFSDPILAASARYGAESVLAARLFKSADGKWKGQWSFFFRSQERNYVFETDTLDQQVLSGLTAAAQVLANSFALKSTGLDGNILDMEVNGVGSLKDYALLVQYLQKLAITQHVSIEKLKKDVLAIQLTLNGSFEQFKQTLSLDRKLIPDALINSEEENFESSEIVRFSWRP